MKIKFKFSLRVFWYSVIIWLLALILGGLVIVPWFYVVLPLFILLATVYYFDKEEIIQLAFGKGVWRQDVVFALGLWVALLWFFVLIILSILEIAGFYYFDFFFYFSDPRNWFLYPLVLLVPVVYSLILENMIFKNRKKKKVRQKISPIIPVEPNVL